MDNNIKDRTEQEILADIKQAIDEIKQSNNAMLQDIKTIKGLTHVENFCSECGDPCDETNCFCNNCKLVGYLPRRRASSTPPSGADEDPTSSQS